MSSDSDCVSCPFNIEKCSLVLVDVAGTTTSINFVKDTLFPFFTDHVGDFLQSKWEEDAVKDCIKLLKEDEGELDISGTVELVKSLMEKNSNNVGLKTLQGLVYKEGYEKDELKAHIFDDVTGAFETWAKVRRVAIYSTGSVESQKLLFKYTASGDVSQHIHKYFDQTVGSKSEAESYKKIAQEEEIKAEEIIFITDDVEEAKAAKSGGVNAVLIRRENNPEISEDASKEFPVITSFNELVFDKTSKRKIKEDATPTEAPPSKVLKTDSVEETEKGNTLQSEEKTTEEETMEVDPPEEKTTEVSKVSETVSEGSENIKTLSEKTEPETNQEVVEKEIKETTQELENTNESKVEETKTSDESSSEPMTTEAQVEESHSMETEPAIKETDVIEETKSSKEESQLTENKNEIEAELPAEETPIVNEAQPIVEDVKGEVEDVKGETEQKESIGSSEPTTIEEVKQDEVKPLEQTEDKSKEVEKEINSITEEDKQPEETKKEPNSVAEEENVGEVKPVAKVIEVEAKEQTEEDSTADKKEVNESKEEKTIENGEKSNEEEAETSTPKIEEKENKSTLANGVENGDKDESKVENSEDKESENFEVKNDGDGDNKDDESEVKVKKLEESAESKTVSVEV